VIRVAGAVVTAAIYHRIDFAAIAALDVWGSQSGGRPVTKVFVVVHLLFAVAFIWVGRKSVPTKPR